ncbi:uncharacterized protein FOMMEDRAFT_158211 [Fomitiporia mediterranea MF3/22]|uniref:uncharacterized protein n=1 Tax=Fomitiporia mediterranea (strain MF3/22) TaxID=694068 RepID=UPI00044093A9|nr:uncharacterized protein FOMMEDRAFT_158211 [Fomitiporia mediterranea MF3/22]EJD01078.1 hypothetical protein FOMMEDRAFT_158211 [Fomitiporia mediterranea MF3/22]
MSMHNLEYEETHSGDINILSNTRQVIEFRRSHCLQLYRDIGMQRSEVPRQVTLSSRAPLSCRDTSADDDIGADMWQLSRPCIMRDRKQNHSRHDDLPSEAKPYSADQAEAFADQHDVPYQLK